MRNGFLSSLLVVLGASFASAQGYPGYPPTYPGYAPAYPVAPAWPAAAPAYSPAPAFPSYHAPRLPAWPAAYQLPGGPMPSWAGAQPLPASQPYLPPQSGMQPPGAAPAPQEPPGKATVLPGERIPPPLPDDSPREPMVSPLPPDAPLKPVPAPPQAPPVHAPPQGTPLTCDLVPEEPPAPPPPSHELHPPRNGPRGYRFYGSADYLFWWIKERSAPTLLATGPVGAVGAVPLLTGVSFDDQERTGARFSLGTWLNQEQTVGFEVGGLWLANVNPAFRSSAPVLARPFADASTGAENAAVLSAPGIQTGSATVTAPSRLWGGEADMRFELLRHCLFHVDLLAGGRYLELDDSLRITDQTTFAASLPGVGGTSIASSDRFGARNQFYGGQVGLEVEWHWGRFFVDGWTKTALGVDHETVNINGTTVVTNAAGQSLALPGGLLAQPSNSGRFIRDEFAVVEEAALNVGVQLTSHLRARFGYTFLYSSSVVRGGDQIDRMVNPTARAALIGPAAAQVGPTRPLFSFHDTDFWAHGFNVGFEFRF